MSCLVRFENKGLDIGHIWDILKPKRTQTKKLYNFSSMHACFVKACNVRSAIKCEKFKILILSDVWSAVSYTKVPLDQF